MDEQKTAKIGLLVFALTLIIAALGFMIWQSFRSPIKKMQPEYGFSLDGVKTAIESSYVDSSFRDNWSIYAVSVEGERAGTLFDDQVMQDGIPDTVKAAVKSKNASLKKNGITPVLTIDPKHQYKYKLVFPKGGSTKLHVILDVDKDLYYLIRGISVFP